MDVFLSSSGAAWLALLGAGIFEIGWPLGLKMAQVGPHRVLGALFAILMMGVSGALLWFAQKTIPMGTAYAVWTGIGAAGTFVFGVVLYGEPASMVRILGGILIILGVVCLKAGH